MSEEDEFYQKSYKKSPDYESYKKRDSYKKRPRPSINYPASKRPTDNKSAIRCPQCGLFDISIKYAVIYNKKIKCEITKGDVLVSASDKDERSITPVITMLCHGCDKQFHLNLYENHGNVVIDRT